MIKIRKSQFEVGHGKFIIEFDTKKEAKEIENKLNIEWKKENKIW